MEIMKVWIGMWMWCLIISFVFIIPILLVFSGNEMWIVLLVSILFVLAGGQLLYLMLK